MVAALTSESILLFFIVALRFVAGGYPVADELETVQIGEARDPIGDGCDLVAGEGERLQIRDVRERIGNGKFEVGEIQHRRTGILGLPNSTESFALTFWGP